MPELPEVETVRRGLEAAITGQVLRGLQIGSKRLRRAIPRAGLERLVGSSVHTLERRGKVLLLHFDGSPAQTMLVHLGMSGYFLMDRASAPWEKHEHVRLQFSNQTVSYIDPRRFGFVDICAYRKLHEHPALARLGPEPLSADFDGTYLFEARRNRKVAIRNLLLDGHVVAGIGNIYANESLFRARIRPTRAAGRLSRADTHRLVEAIKQVLSQAIKAGGTTLSDGGYRTVEGESGWFQIQVDVYDRAGEDCYSCAKPIKHIMVGQRSAFYCPGCQK